MFRDGGNAALVLSKRPRAAALPRETERRVGIQGEFFAGTGRNARTGLVEEESSNLQGRSAAAGANGREPSFGNSARMGRKGESQ